MKSSLLKSLLAGAVLAFSSVCNAGLIVDTGSNPNGNTWSWYEYQSFSGQFTTTQAWTINSIEAFVSNYGSAGTFDVAVWSSAGNTPLAVLFNSTGSIAQGAIADWYGVYNLNQVLAAGTYWVSMTPGAGVDGVHYGGAPNPLVAYNQRSTGNPWQWDYANPGQHLAIGFRIDASAVNSVPAPTTIALLGLGIIGLASRRSNKKN